MTLCKLKYIQFLLVNHTSVKLEEKISKCGPVSTTTSFGAFAPGSSLRTHEALRVPLFQGTQNPFQRPWGWSSLRYPSSGLGSLPANPQQTTCPLSRCLWAEGRIKAALVGCAVTGLSLSDGLPICLSTLTL